MPKEQSPGKPMTRRYTDQEKADAVRLVRALCTELGTERGTVPRIAGQLGNVSGEPGQALCALRAPVDPADRLKFERARRRSATGGSRELELSGGPAPGGLPGAGDGVLAPASHQRGDDPDPHDIATLPSARADNQQQSDD